MKTKKVSQRLILNKKTVANLNPGAMAVLKGGCDKTSPLSGCPSLTNYTCLAETCPTDCYQTCQQATCVTCQTACGTIPDCPCPYPLEP